MVSRTHASTTRSSSVAHSRRCRWLVIETARTVCACSFSHMPKAALRETARVTVSCVYLEALAKSSGVTRETYHVEIDVISCGACDQ